MTLRRRIVAALLVSAILTSGFFVGLLLTNGDSSIQAQEQAVTPVITDPIPADAIRVCETCVEHDLQATIRTVPESLWMEAPGLRSPSRVLFVSLVKTGP